MDNNTSLVEIKKEGFFSKIKNFFKKLFGKNNDNSDLLFEKQFNVDEELEYEENNSSDKLKYEFSSNVVSKQHIQKIKEDLDSSKIGFGELYELKDNELEELKNTYNNQIEDTINKLNEVDANLNLYKIKLQNLKENPEYIINEQEI